jgi:hypothetical protein
MAFYKHKRSPFGCCSTGSATALGQLDEGPLAATSAPEIPYPGAMPPGTLRSLFAVSVGAGLTVWAVTRWLGRSR